MEDDLYITVLQGFTMQRYKIMLEYPNIRMVKLLNYNNLTGYQGTTSYNKVEKLNTLFYFYTLKLTLKI